MRNYRPRRTGFRTVTANICRSTHRLEALALPVPIRRECKNAALGSKLTKPNIVDLAGFATLAAMADTIKRSRTDTYEHTVNGLLTKRADLFNEAQRIRDRLAEIKNDVGAIDRVLGTLGYTGDLDAEMPRQKREVLFGRGELTRAILDELRDATEPMTSRQIAQAIVAVGGQDARDRRLMADVTKRVSKALRGMKTDGNLQSKIDNNGNVVWRMESNSCSFAPPRKDNLRHPLEI